MFKYIPLVICLPLILGEKGLIVSGSIIIFFVFTKTITYVITLTKKASLRKVIVMNDVHEAKYYANLESKERIKKQVIIDNFLEEKMGFAVWNWLDSQTENTIEFLDETNNVITGKLYFNNNNEITYVKCEGRKNIMGKTKQRVIAKKYLENMYKTTLEANLLEMNKLAEIAKKNGSAIYNVPKNGTSYPPIRETRIIAEVLEKYLGFSTAEVVNKKEILVKV